ncbi:efflux RND transporter periplasmic adaptor subunit [Pedobacter gandavensis]|uniref:efflux RND transporter periplasmic adaptor subunit n=1 Tax=Pedobacter gandavensis TaxID=2679963 RepID=UPI0029307E53|nr:efflux RND transporter periplasmic adaptor subunit [Pedobacter gandavensis]
MQIIIKNISKLSFIGLVIASQSCSSSKEAPVSEKFAVTDSLINRLLVDTVQQANNRTDLNFSAKITANEERKADIFPMLSGTVRSVPVRLGDKVIAGQVLATMGSAEMAGFDKEASSAAAELRTAERQVKQAEELFKSGLSSSRELEEAKNDLLIKQAENKRALATLRLNGGNHTGNYTIKSPLSGFIIDKNVNVNMQVRPDNDNKMFTVADLSTVWAMVNIYESDISKIKEGDEVQLSILSYPDKMFKGRINKIYNMIDNESKVINARVIIANPGYLLKPGMMATVMIAAKSGIDLPVVNSRGIIFDENKNYVLLLDATNKIRIQEVEIGRKTADKAYISKGLNAGDRVIASKQVFLYESLKN